jgi:hypothetical protein
MPWSSPEGDLEWLPPAAVTSKLRKRRSLVTEEYSYARARARRPLKVTVPSPLVLYGFWSPRHSSGAYPDAFAMFADAAEIGRSEVLELVSLGCEYIQVDAPELATLVDPRVRDWAESLGFSAERMLSEGIDLINGMVQSISGVRLGIHLCRGNNVGMWMASGGYDYIAQALFERATAFDAFFLEYDDARSGSFEPLAGAPRRQADRARARLDQEPAARVAGGGQFAHRGGGALLPARAARAVDPVRLRVGRRGQPADRAPRGAQAAAGRRHRARRLELVRLHGQAVAARGDDRPRALGPIARRMEHEPIAVERPRARRVHGKVDGAGDAFDVGAVWPELERRPAAGERERMRRGPEDHLRPAVLLVRVHPAAVQMFRSDHAISDSRGPARVAFMRAIWPTENMTIVSSST